MLDFIPAVIGPTAVGKTKYAIEIARHFDGEIISCDSMQLYKYMDIGSAKPTADEQRQARHHLVDIIDPREPFSAAKYQVLAEAAIADVINRGKTPVICGGTGLYFNSLIYDMDFSAEPEDLSARDELFEIARVSGPEALYQMLLDLDPDSAQRIHPNNIKRVVRAIEAARSGKPIRDIGSVPRRERYRYMLIGLMRDREKLYDRVNRRVDILMEEGLLDEVRALMSMGLTEADISMKGIGYKELIAHLNGEYDLDEAVRLIKQNTRHFAKRQMTWFRRYDDMHWFDISAYESDDTCIGDIIDSIETASSQMARK